MIVVYHRADMDGICSAAIAACHWPDAQLVGADYGDDLESALPPPDPGDRRLLMVDFSLPIGQMVEIAGRHDLIWVDHHHTVISAAAAAGFAPEGLRRVGQAGCELLWEWLYRDALALPTAVRLLGRYDVWDLSADERLLPFQFAARHHLRDPRDWRWRVLLEDGPGAQATIKELIEDGELLRQSSKRARAEFARECSFETTLDGLRCVAINGGRGSGALAAVWDSARYDAMLTFGFTGRHWRVGLYTDRPDVDVSAVAVAHGGGGHRGAAGFECARLPFELPGGVA